MQNNKRDLTSKKELEEEIRQKEYELHRHYSQMGKSILEMAEGEQRIIDRLVDELIDARSQLAQIKELKQCPECTAYNDADSRYCKRCGTALSPQEPKKEKET